MIKRQILFISGPAHLDVERISKELNITVIHLPENTSVNLVEIINDKKPVKK